VEAASSDAAVVKDRSDVAAVAVLYEYVGRPLKAKLRDLEP